MARFDEDTYSRARKFVESSGDEEPKKTFKQAFAEARKAGNSTFTWNGKKYSTEVASERAKESPAVPGRPRGERAPAPARAQSTVAQGSSGVPDERARLAARYGTAEQRAKYSRDQMISQSDMDAAKAAGEERRRKIREQDEAFTESRNRAIKRLLGTQAMREEANMAGGGKAKAYAKGGSVRGNGCAQRGKTRGTMR